MLSAAGQLALEYDAPGTLADSYDVAGVDNFFALNLDPDGSRFWTGSFVNGTRYKFAIGGAAPTTTINTGSGSRFGVAVYGEVTAGCGTNCTGAAPPDDAQGLSRRRYAGASQREPIPSPTDLEPLKLGFW